MMNNSMGMMPNNNIINMNMMSMMNNNGGMMNNNMGMMPNNMGMMNNNNMVNTTLNRITKEFQLCQNDTELIQIGCSFGLVDNNYYNWKVTMVGPKDTPYEGGLFTINIVFPPNYPKKGAEFKFKNKIYHLNVDWRDTSKPDELGHICLSTLNEWRSTGKVQSKKGFGVKQALFDVFCLFYNQGTESPYDLKLAEQYKINREQFNEEAKKWTKMYAK